MARVEVLDEKSAAAFNKELRKAILSQDVKTFRHFHNKWTLLGIFTKPLVKSDAVLEVGLRKMVANMQTAPTKDINRAKKWLSERGYSWEI